MTDPTLRQALAYARRGWPVFPCLPGQKIPATTHGYKNATTDLDFRASGGYIVAPPSQVGGKPYRLIRRPGGHGTLDWA